MHRLAAELIGLGWLERTGRHYRLGAKLFELGSLVPRRRDPREAALPTFSAAEVVEQVLSTPLPSLTPVLHHRPGAAARLRSGL